MNKVAEALEQVVKFADIALKRLNGTHECMIDISAGHCEGPPVEKDGVKWATVTYDGTWRVVIDVKPKEKP